MSKLISSGFRARSIQFLGAAFVLAAPSVALAQGKLCPVEISVTSGETIGALQLTVDYAALAAVGDITGCTIVQAGITDVLTNPAGDETTLGYADTAGFTGPASFATCFFKVNNAADPDPIDGNFNITVDDASDTDVPPNTITPTVVAAVGACVPSGSCSATPETGCKTPFTTGKSQVQVKNNADDTKDQGKFQWKAGSATDISEFADPTTAGETWSWCLYDDGALISGVDVPSGTGWAAAGSTGFQFKGDSNGVAKLKVKAGDDGKAQVQVQAKSKLGNYSAPAPAFTGPVVSQVVIDDGVAPVCYQATFTAPKVNDGTKGQYKSKD